MMDDAEIANTLNDVVDPPYSPRSRKFREDLRMYLGVELPKVRKRRREQDGGEEDEYGISLSGELGNKFQKLKSGFKDIQSKKKQPSNEDQEAIIKALRNNGYDVITDKMDVYRCKDGKIPGRGDKLDKEYVKLIDGNFTAMCRNWGPIPKGGEERTGYSKRPLDLGKLKKELEWVWKNPNKPIIVAPRSHTKFFHDYFAAVQGHDETLGYGIEYTDELKKLSGTRIKHFGIFTDYRSARRFQAFATYASQEEEIFKECAKGHFGGDLDEEVCDDVERVGMRRGWIGEEDMDDEPTDLQALMKFLQAETEKFIPAVDVVDQLAGYVESVVCLSK